MNLRIFLASNLRRGGEGKKGVKNGKKEVSIKKMGRKEPQFHLPCISRLVCVFVRYVFGRYFAARALM